MHRLFYSLFQHDYTEFIKNVVFGMLEGNSCRPIHGKDKTVVEYNLIQCMAKQHEISMNFSILTRIFCSELPLYHHLLTEELEHYCNSDNEIPLEIAQEAMSTLIDLFFARMLSGK